MTPDAAPLRLLEAPREPPEPHMQFAYRSPQLVARQAEPLGRVAQWTAVQPEGPRAEVQEERHWLKREHP